jgi:16S rRNA (uracil1498-N3)-methyltransferase
VNEIVPAVTERSQLRDTRRVKRWRKIAEEASRQSGRSVVPVVHEPVELRKYLTSSAFQSASQGFIFYEEGGISLKHAFHMMQDARYTIHDRTNKGGLICSIGPEGGFTKEEVQFAEEQGLTVVSLGKRVLRAETAAISAVTLVQYLFGDMS